MLSSNSKIPEARVFSGSNKSSGLWTRVSRVTMPQFSAGEAVLQVLVKIFNMEA